MEKAENRCPGPSSSSSSCHTESPRARYPGFHVISSGSRAGVTFFRDLNVMLGFSPPTRLYPPSYPPLPFPFSPLTPNTPPWEGHEVRSLCWPQSLAAMPVSQGLPTHSRPGPGPAEQAAQGQRDGPARQPHSSSRCQPALPEAADTFPATRPGNCGLRVKTVTASC